VKVGNDGVRGAGQGRRAGWLLTVTGLVVLGAIAKAAGADVSAKRLAGHDLPVEALAFSTDGRMAASGSRDHTIKLWEVESGKLVRKLEGHAGDVKAVAFSADGKRVVSGGGDRNVARLDPKAENDCSVRVWDVDSGRQVLRLEGHSVEVCSVAFSPDGTRIASGGADRVCIVWDAVAGREIARTPRQAGRVERVAFSPDERGVLTGTDDGELTLWDSGTLRRLKTFGGKLGKISCLALSADGKYVASGRDDALVQKRMSGLAEQTRTTFRDCSVRVWDAASGKELRKFARDDFGPVAVAFSKDSGRVAALMAGEVRVWRFPDGQEAGTFQLQEAGTRGTIAFGPDGLWAMNSVGFFDGTVWIYKVSAESVR